MKSTQDAINPRGTTVTFTITDIKERPAQGLLPALTWPLPAAPKGLVSPAPGLPVAPPGQPSPAPAIPSLRTPRPVRALGERTPGATAPGHCETTLAGGKPESGTKCSESPCVQPWLLPQTKAPELHSLLLLPHGRTVESWMQSSLCNLPEAKKEANTHSFTQPSSHMPTQKHQVFGLTSRSFSWASSFSSARTPSSTRSSSCCSSAFFSSCSRWAFSAQSSLVVLLHKLSFSWAEIFALSISSTLHKRASFSPSSCNHRSTEEIKYSKTYSEEEESSNSTSPASR